MYPPESHFLASLMPGTIPLERCKVLVFKALSTSVFQTLGSLFSGYAVTLWTLVFPACFWQLTTLGI